MHLEFVGFTIHARRTMIIFRCSLMFSDALLVTCDGPGTMSTVRNGFCMRNEGTNAPLAGCDPHHQKRHGVGCLGRSGGAPMRLRLQPNEHREKRRPTVLYCAHKALCVL